ncbi:class I SAM-dependent methyltransferase [Candidatus Peregrinibacteria bacterium]|nr:class I SAM-dependent methyltransferase [Candidatus Peregrinibacteria bacterium]
MKKVTDIDLNQAEGEGSSEGTTSEGINEALPTSARVEAAVSTGVKMAVDHLGSREELPDAFLLELSKKFGNVRWSDEHKGRLIVDSLEAPIETGGSDLIYLEGYLANVPGVKVVKSPYGGFTNVIFEFNGKKYEVFGRKEVQINYEFGSSRDRVFLANLESLKDVLPPNPRVLYLGAYADPSVRKVFGPSVTAVDISGDHLKPGDVKADARNLPFKSDSFDLVVMKDGLNFNLDPIVKNEVIRVLSYNGLVFNTMTMEREGRDIRLAVSRDGKTSLEMAAEFRDLYTDGGSFVNVEGVDIDGLEQSSLLRINDSETAKVHMRKALESVGELLSDEEWDVIWSMHMLGGSGREHLNEKVAIAHSYAAKLSESARPRWRKIYKFALQKGYAGFLSKLLRRKGSKDGVKVEPEAEAKPGKVAIVELDSRGRPMVSDEWKIVKSNPDGTVDLERNIEPDSEYDDVEVQTRNGVNLNSVANPAALNSWNPSTGTRVYMLTKYGYPASYEEYTVEYDEKGVMVLVGFNGGHRIYGQPSRFVADAKSWNAFLSGKRPKKPEEEVDVSDRPLQSISDRNLQRLLDGMFDLDRPIMSDRQDFQFRVMSSEHSQHLSELFILLELVSKFMPRFVSAVANRNFEYLTTVELEDMHRITAHIFARGVQRALFLEGGNDEDRAEARKWRDLIIDRVGRVNAELTTILGERGGNATKVHPDNEADWAHYSDDYVLDGIPMGVRRQFAAQVAHKKGNDL